LTLIWVALDEGRESDDRCLAVLVDRRHQLGHSTLLLAPDHQVMSELVIGKGLTDLPEQLAHSLRLVLSLESDQAHLAVKGFDGRPVLAEPVERS
jgi:hypothetical protein